MHAGYALVVLGLVRRVGGDGADGALSGALAALDAALAGGAGVQGHAAVLLVRAVPWDGRLGEVVRGELGLDLRAKVGHCSLVGGVRAAGGQLRDH